MTTNILIIDDDEGDFILAKECLTNPTNAIPTQKINVTTVSWARCLKDGLQQLKCLDFDAAVLDLTLPDAKGLDVFRAVASQHPTLPIILLTGLDDQDLAKQALHEGAQDYVVKSEMLMLLSRSLTYALERHKATLELKQAREDALAASRAKSSFLANMSHEIRTPLTAIIGYAETMICSDLTTPELDRAKICVLENSQHLLQVINDILDVSKIEAGKLEVDKHQCSYFPAIRHVDAAMTMKAHEKGVSFNVEYELPLPRTILTDDTRLKQILFNLAGNGLKFTKEGGVKLIVSYDKSALTLRFDVVDTGIGIPKENQTRLFEAFSQGDTSITRSFGGTGLGLVISKELAEKLGGSIELQSEEGKGSTFSLLLPINSDSASDLITSLPEQDYSALLTSRPAPRLSHPARILLVEDHKVNQEYISFVLSKLGIEVEVAENGAVAVEKALVGHHDLILMDMRMPIMDGFEASRILRERGYQSPIIALTASIANNMIHKCKEAGCDDYIAKPFSRKDFVDLITEHLSNHMDVQETSETPHTLNLNPLFPDTIYEEPEIMEIVMSFIDRLPQRIEEIEEAYRAKNWEHIQFLAHKLKGALVMGYSPLGQAAGELEISALRANNTDIEQALNTIKNLCHRIAIGKEHIAKELLMDLHSCETSTKSTHEVA